MTTQLGRAVRLDAVEPITWGGEEAARFLLRGADTGGLFSFYEVSVPPGEGSLFHVHEDMDETFYVIEGEFQIRIDGSVHQAPAGVLVYGPRGVGHSFLNTSHQTSRMLCIATPGGIEGFFEELSDLVAEDPPPEWEQLRALAAQHRIIASAPGAGPPGGALDATPGEPAQETSQLAQERE
jgi:quercetin dioxygenase-like cupin family protein